jgi:hypothetical protein
MPSHFASPKTGIVFCIAFRIHIASPCDEAHGSILDKSWPEAPVTSTGQRLFLQRFPWAHRHWKDNVPWQSCQR